MTTILLILGLFMLVVFLGYVIYLATKNSYMRAAAQGVLWALLTMWWLGTASYLIFLGVKS